MGFFRPQENGPGPTPPAVEVGMTMKQVMAVVGIPDRAESFRHDGNQITIWLFDRDQSTTVVWFDAESKVKGIGGR